MHRHERFREDFRGLIIRVMGGAPMAVGLVCRMQILVAGGAYWVKVGFMHWGSALMGF